MKVFIEVDNNYVLLSDEVNKDNFDNYLIREEAINQAMDKLQEYKMKLEIERLRKNPVKMKTLGVKKLGLHPSMKQST